eukprot:gene5295-18540_t
MKPYPLFCLLLLLLLEEHIPVVLPLKLGKLSWTTEELGVQYISIPGQIPVPATQRQPARNESVLLHTFITAHHVVSSDGRISTKVKGYFFAESISSYRFTPWGQPAQSWAVYKWRYPVVLLDLQTGQQYTLDLKTVRVQKWLHTGQLCFQDTPGPLDLWSVEKPGQHIVWAVMTPWRGLNMEMYVQAVLHYNLHHLKVRLNLEMYNQAVLHYSLHHLNVRFEQGDVQPGSTTCTT